MKRKRKKGCLLYFLFAFFGIIIFVVTAGNKPAESNVDDFIYYYTISTKTPVTSVDDLDIDGADYRREYRNSSFDNAIGKKCTFNGGSMEVVTYGYRFMEKVRIYAAADSMETLVDMYRTAAAIFDSSLSGEQIDNALTDLEHTWTFSLGNKTNISGYIKEVTYDGSFVRYELLMDCDGVLYG